MEKEKKKDQAKGAFTQKVLRKFIHATIFILREGIEDHPNTHTNTLVKRL
jgi:hypothetical protein